MAESKRILEVLLPEIRAVREDGERGLREIREAISELSGDVREQGTLLRQLHRSDELQTGTITELKLELTRLKQKPSSGRLWLAAVVILAGVLAATTGDSDLLARILSIL